MAKKIINSTQDIVEVEEIETGIVKTTDGRYVKIIEIEPINFHLRSEKEKKQIIYDFAAWLKIAPVKIHFKTVSNPTDIGNYLVKINEEKEKEPNELCRNLQDDYLKLICDVGFRQGVERRFFIIIEYEKKNIISDKFNEILYALNMAAATIESMLKRCGNAVIHHSDEDASIRELFYMLYNRRPTETLYERAMNIVQRRIKNGITDHKDVKLKDLLAPVSIRQEKDYLVINDVYYRILYMPSDGYRTKVLAGWMSGVINAGEGVDVDFFLEKQNKIKLRNKISQKIRINTSKFKETEDTNPDYDDLSQAIQSGYYLRDRITAGEDFYYMYTLITVIANTKEDLDYRTEILKQAMQAVDMEMKDCNYHMIDAFMSTMPLCNISEQLKSKSRRNVLTNGAASLYPFSSFEITDDDGILLGINKQNNSLCILDIYNSEKYKNANISILGTSGAGKTFLLQTMALRMRMRNIQVFIIAPLKGHEYKRAAAAIGGEYIKINPGSPNNINIMEIRPIDKTSERFIDDNGNEVEETSALARKIQNVRTFFSLIIPDMSYEEAELLDAALVKTYNKKGITYDNESLIDRNKPMIAGKTLVYKEMPILKDAYDELILNPKTERIATILNRYVNGSAASFSRPTNVDLNNKYVIIDISEFGEDMQAIGMFVALDYIYDKVKEDRTQKKAVFIDETWKLIGSNSNSLAANFVLEMFKIIRGYGGAAIAATQDVNDFFALDDGKFGRGIIANSKTKIILQLEPHEAEYVQRVFNLTEAETMDIMRFERGSGLIITNSNNVAVKFIASTKEEELITSDRQRLEQILEKQKQKKTGII